VDPLFSAAWNNLAQVAFERNELALAHSAITHALRLNPTADASVLALDRKIAEALSAQRGITAPATATGTGPSNLPPTSPPPP
jgi:cytochrome c-type biogenesis protein CcmH/NrfG